MLHWGVLRVSVHAAGRGAGELVKELVGGLEWDFSCMESSESPPHTSGCVSHSSFDWHSGESLMQDF